MTIRGTKISQVKFNFPRRKSTLKKPLSKTQRSKLESMYNLLGHN